jgi:hypothetical protein
MSSTKIGPHDLGGDDAGRVSSLSRDLQWWEKRIDALYRLLADDRRMILKVDELRAAIEALGDDVYAHHDYYERWTLALRKLLVAKQVLDEAEIETRIAALKQNR